MSFPYVGLESPESVFPLYCIDSPALVEPAVIHPCIEYETFRHGRRFQPVFSGPPSQHDLLSVPDDG